MGAQAREDLTQLVVDAHDTDEWQEALENNGWLDTFQTGDEYGEFLAEEEVRVRQVLTGIGLIP
jgi:putative tricarboxylic transport membrane protein